MRRSRLLALSLAATLMVSTSAGAQVAGLSNGLSAAFKIGPHGDPAGDWSTKNLYATGGQLSGVDLSPSDVTLSGVTSNLSTLLAPMGLLNQANGLAQLDTTGHIPSALLPAGVGGSNNPLASAYLSGGNTGSTPRTLQAHFSDTFNVKDYGAVGDGSSDDTVAFQNCFNAALQAATNVAVRIDIPPGRYMLSASWNPALSTPHSFSIDGAGPGMTTVVFANSDGFDITGTQSHGNLDVEVSGMRLLTGDTTSQYANTGITITSPFVSGEEVHPVIAHVLMTDAALKQANGWAIGVNLNTTVNADLDDVIDEMPGWNSTTPTTGVGVQVEGQIAVASDFSISTHIHHSTLTGGYAGVLVGSYVQTVDVANSVIIGNDYGFRWDGSTTGDFAENPQITSNNFNALAADIWLSHVNEGQIEGNMLLQFGNVANWSAINIESSGWEAITGNTVVALPQAAPTAPATYNTTNGFVIDNSAGSSAAIAGNIITGLHGVCIVLSGTTSMVAASGNVCNGPFITTPYSETNLGTNMLGPVSFNSNPPPVRFDGFHLDILSPGLWFPLTSGNGAAILEGDNAGNLSIINSFSGTAGLTLQGSLTAGANILPGPGSALITRDAGGANGATENAGYLQPDNLGGLRVGTLRPGGVAGLTATWIAGSVATGLSAAGTTQATATALATQNNVVTTVASGSGVMLPATSTLGAGVKVFNRGANALLVYPPSGFGIESAAANVAVSLAAGADMSFTRISATQFLQ